MLDKMQGIPVDCFLPLAGPVLIAINPFKVLSDAKTGQSIYHESVMDSYRGRVRGLWLGSRTFLSHAARRFAGILRDASFCVRHC
jgi:hypothetical protein